MKFFWKKKPEAHDASPSTRAVGARGEALAILQLKKLGYRVLEQNFHCRGGEIDIVESVNIADTVYGTIHYGGEWPDNTHSGGSYADGTDFSEDFHTYAIEWEPAEIRWYVDGILYNTETSWWSSGDDFPAPFDQRFHFLLNTAVGGNWPGSPDGSTVLPQQMVVDYVRVYQKP